MANRTVTLDGCYRVPMEEAARLLETIGCRSTKVVARELNDIAEIEEDSGYGASALRVMREEILRFEREELPEMTPRWPQLAPAAVRESERSLFRRDEKRWTLCFGGEQGKCRHSFGLVYVQELLRNPHKQIDAVALETAAKGDLPTSVHNRGDELMDEQARRESKARLGAIDDEIEDARERGAPDRIDQLEEQKNQILIALKQATGLGGRSRRMADDVDKARKRVCEAITAAIRAIGEELPELAEHLQASVDLGASPAYRPAEPIPWEF